MTDNYPLEPGQRMIIRPNTFNSYSKLWHKVVVLGKIVSTENGIIAKDCSYVDKEFNVHTIDIPLFLLWRIADDENLLEMHENYIHTIKEIKNKSE